LHNNIYFHNCHRAAAFICNIHSSHQKVNRALVYPVMKVNYDSNLREIHFGPHSLLSIFHWSQNVYELWHVRKYKAEDKTCCMRPNFGLIQKGGKLLCHGTNANYLTNLKKCSIVIYN
jgi:hypothetical protein